MAGKLFGYAGKILRVDLDQKKCRTEEPEPTYYQKYLGGRGIIIHTLLKEMSTSIDPLGPDNKLIFVTGPLTGHKFMGSGRFGVGGKSPLTGAYGEAEAGGLWGVQLKKAGYDAVIVEGCSTTPVYLLIKNETVTIIDAGPIWGAEVKETIDWIRKENNESRLSCAVIGLGGENQVLFANIIADSSHAFGRCGLGAVMGAKRLKAIAVKGDNSVEPFNNKEIKALNAKMKEKYWTSPFVKYGTGGGMQKLEKVGTLPVKNYTGGFFPKVKDIDAVALMTKYGTGMDTCYNCPVRCKKRIKINNGPFKIDPVYGGPEYETLASFGSNLLIDNIEAICKAHELCNRYSLDTVSTGATIAFAMECFENGLLTRDDTDGVPLAFGDAEVMVELIEKIAFRKGIGELLAQGTKRAAETIGKGAVKYAMQVKGLELPYHEPRYKQGLGLHYTIHGTGADHCSGVMDDALPLLIEDWESLNVTSMMEPTELSLSKVRMAYEMGFWSELPNYLGCCIFVPWNIAELRDATAAVTGWPVTTWKLMKAVERGITLMRIFNLKNGFSRKDDCLPDRFFTRPPDGPIKDISVDPTALQEAQVAYYQMMGWDESGIPTKGTLAALDLEWAIPLLDG